MTLFFGEKNSTAPKKNRENREGEKTKEALFSFCFSPPSCFWTILRTDFERKHGKIVPAVSQRPNFLLPFSVSRFPNRFFCFFLFLVAASSRSMLLQLLQRLHLFFFLDYTVRFPILSPPPACCCKSEITKRTTEKKNKTLSLSLSRLKKDGAFVRFRRA